MIHHITALVAALAATARAQQSQAQPISDPGTYGPQVEIAHLYYDEWPTGTFHWLTSTTSCQSP